MPITEDALNDAKRCCEEMPPRVAHDTLAQSSGILYGSALEPARPNIRERVAKQLEYSQTEARKVGRLRELSRLLEKNPDVARILDLVEEVRY